MRTKTTFRGAGITLCLFATAAAALAGCDGAAADPAANGGAVEAAAEHRQAVKEVAAPESTRIHAPISEADAARMLASIADAKQAEAAAAKPAEAADVKQAEAADAKPAQAAEAKAAQAGASTESAIIPIFFKPDLTVVEDDRSQWRWDPNNKTWYPGMARGFVISNSGIVNAGTFHVAVLQGSDSYGFDVPGLAAGASEYFQITKPSDLGPACGTSAVVLVNPFNALPESNYNNNAATIAGICLW